MFRQCKDCRVYTDSRQYLENQVRGLSKVAFYHMWHTAAAEVCFTCITAVDSPEQGVQKSHDTPWTAYKFPRYSLDLLFLFRLNQHHRWTTLLSHDVLTWGSQRRLGLQCNRTALTSYSILWIWEVDDVKYNICKICVFSVISRA